MFQLVRCLKIKTTDTTNTDDRLKPKNMLFVYVYFSIGLPSISNNGFGGSFFCVSSEVMTNTIAPIGITRGPGAYIANHMSSVCW